MTFFAPIPVGVSIGTLFNNYIIVVNQAYAWTLVAVFTAVFAVAVPWLVNRPQPTPNWSKR